MMFKMLMRDPGIILKNNFPCAFFGEDWINAGNITFLLSH